MKKFTAIFFAIILTACGFTPMYSGDKKIDVYVAPISGTNGIDLRNALDAKFGGSNDIASKYKLTVKLSDPVTRYKAIQSTGDATWQEVILNASYTLTDGARTVATGSESASESYTFVRYLVAANASYNNAVQNDINVLAEKIGLRIIASVESDKSNQ
jgi:hypothetical protein